MFLTECPLDIRMWTLCDKQSSFQFQIWWKNSRVENLLLWCQKYFSPTRPDTRAQRGTFKVIMRRWWGLLCWRQVKDKLKGSLSVLSTMMGWHEPVWCDVTRILRLGWHRGLCWAQLWLRLSCLPQMLSLSLECWLNVWQHENNPLDMSLFV